MECGYVGLVARDKGPLLGRELAELLQLLVYDEMAAPRELEVRNEDCLEVLFLLSLFIALCFGMWLVAVVVLLLLLLLLLLTLVVLLLLLPVVAVVFQGCS